MTPADFTAIINHLFSHHRSPIQAAADFLDINHTTVWRYANGTTPIPRSVQYSLMAANLLGTDFFTSS